MNKTKILADEEKCLAARNQAFIAYLTRRGLLADQQVTDEATKKRRQEAAKRAYHNTQLLLENYRDIAWALESMPNQIASELAMPFATLDELMFRIDLEIAMDNKKLESRLNSITKSRLLIDRINEALSVLKSKPKVGKDCYQVIYKTYIDPSFDGTVMDMLYDLNMSKRKYYSCRKEAIRLISLRLWSAPDKETDMWLDVLMMLNSRDDYI